MRIEDEDIFEYLEDTCDPSERANMTLNELIDLYIELTRQAREVSSKFYYLKEDITGQDPETDLEIYEVTGELIIVRDILIHRRNCLLELSDTPRYKDNDKLSNATVLAYLSILEGCSDRLRRLNFRGYSLGKEYTQFLQQKEYAQYREDLSNLANRLHTAALESLSR